MTMDDFKRNEAPRMKEVTKVMDSRVLELPDPQSDESLVSVDEMKHFIASLSKRDWLIFSNLLVFSEMGVL